MDGNLTVDLCLTAAAIHARAGRLKSALVLAGLGLSKAPDDARLRRLSAYLALEAGRPAEALAHLKRLETLEPLSGAHGSPRDVLAARALLALGRMDEARARFARHLGARSARGDAETAS